MYKNISDFMKIWNGHIQNNQYACIWAQSCLTLCIAKDCSLPGSFVHGIFFRQEYWSGLPFSPPGDLPNLGINFLSPALYPTLAGGFFIAKAPGKPHLTEISTKKIIPRCTTEKFLKNDEEKSYLKDNQKGEED